MGEMANDVLHETGRQEGAGTQVSELHQRRNTKAVQGGKTASIDWEWMTILLMQVQEHVQTLSRQGLEGEAARALDSLTHCTDELLPALMDEARRR
jgi:hypothetical protein